MSDPLDSWLPDYHVRSTHSRRSTASPDRLWATVRDTPISDLRVSRALLALRRGRPGRPKESTFGEMSRAGMFTLLEEGDRFTVSGIAGRFWSPSGGRARIESAADYMKFRKPGTAKAALLMQVREHPGGSELLTETRVWCSDDSARRRFRAYWTLIGPFSGLIRRDMLTAITRRAERPGPG